MKDLPPGAKITLHGTFTPPPGFDEEKYLAEKAARIAAEEAGEIARKERRAALRARRLMETENGY